MEGEAFDEDLLFANFEEQPNEEDEEALNQFRKAHKKHKKQKKAKIEEVPKQVNNGIDQQQMQYIAELEQQNAKLKATIKRIVGPQAFSFEDDKGGIFNDEINLLEKLERDIQSKPFAVVLYLNNDVSHAHRKEIHEMFRSLSEKKATQDVLMTKKFKAQNSAVPLKAFAANPLGKRSHLGKSGDKEDQHVISACMYYKSFFLDRMGCPLLENDPSITDIWDIPNYQQLYLKALPLVEETMNVRVRQIMQCFNCGGEHHLSACTMPHDQKRINESRKQQAVTKLQSPAANKFQPDDENSERFKHFKPGEISVGLEEALGISLKKQLPPYIYKMRVLGYPLAWLKPAEDGLKMYGAEGDLLDEPGAEEGEIKAIKLPPIINYPGFNSPMPEGIEDEAPKFNMLPFQPELADLDIARKRSQMLGYTPTEPLAKKLRYDDDMDIEDDSCDESNPRPPLIETAENLQKPPLPSESESELPSDGTMDGLEDGEVDSSPSKVQKVERKPKKLEPKEKKIDETTYRNWYIHEPLSTIGITYFMYTPPPTMALRQEISLCDIPKNPITELDREPWKTASVSWYDPLYGDLAAPTGTFDAIRGLLKQNRRSKRKPMV